MPRQHHRDHHGRPDHRFDGRKHAAAEFVRDVPQQLRQFSTELTATAARESAMKNSAQLEILHLAEDDVGGAVQDVADRNGALVAAETRCALPSQ